MDSGRATFNLSEWDKPQGVDLGEIAESIRGSGMPPWYYRLLHSGSRLPKTEREQLIAGLTKTFQTSPPIPGGGG